MSSSEGESDGTTNESRRRRRRRATVPPSLATAQPDDGPRPERPLGTAGRTGAPTGDRDSGGPPQPSSSAASAARTDSGGASAASAAALSRVPVPSRFRRRSSSKSAE
eukprot:Selendium_serpulae@DN6348_c2_g2_i2.p2